MRLQLPFASQGAVAVDLRGRELSGVPVWFAGRQVRVALRPWQIVTLAVQPPR